MTTAHPSTYRTGEPGSVHSGPARARLSGPQSHSQPQPPRWAASAVLALARDWMGWADAHPATSSSAP